jgi:hypothetical protein
VIAIRNSVAGLFRLNLAAAAIGSAVFIGAVTMKLADGNAYLVVAGAVAVCGAGLRAAVAVRASRRARVMTGRALARELVERDDERRVLKQLLHDDVLQLMVVASWTTTQPAGRDALLASEQKVRALLVALEPLIPELGGFEERLRRMVRAVRPQTDVVVRYVRLGGLGGADGARVLLWQVAEAAVACGLKESSPMQVTVEITVQDGAWRIGLFDDGYGPVSRELRIAELGALGDRLVDAGGWLHIGVLRAGGGFVEASIPLGDGDVTDDVFVGCDVLLRDSRVRETVFNPRAVR